jgi:glycosyltransferase involved in cell wall biosynthesis
MVKLSIIVPIYGVEQYLRKCVDSLLDQDMSDYEIILVDDGSPDECPSICDDYVHRLENGDWKLKNVQIRVIHRENGGLSAARNSGIEVAKGEYVMFVDSDDYIEANVLKGLLTQVERDNLDVLRYRLQYVRVMNERVNELTNEREYQIFNPYKSDPFRGNDYSEVPTDGVSFLNSRMNTQCYAWQFIIKRGLIYNDEMSRDKSLNEPLTLNDACLFTPEIYFEDTDWTPRMLVRAKRVASTNTIVYNYLMREGSITNAVNRSKQKKVLDDKMYLISSLQKQSNELQIKGLDNQWFSRMVADNVISIIGIIARDFYTERKEYLSQLKQYGVYPIQSTAMKARLINFSPRIAVGLLHLKNS